MQTIRQLEWVNFGDTGFVWRSVISHVEWWISLIGIHRDIKFSVTVPGHPASFKEDSTTFYQETDITST